MECSQCGMEASELACNTCESCTDCGCVCE